MCPTYLCTERPADDREAVGGVAHVGRQVDGLHARGVHPLGRFQRRVGRECGRDRYLTRRPGGFTPVDRPLHAGRGGLAVVRRVAQDDHVPDRRRQPVPRGHISGRLDLEAVLPGCDGGRPRRCCPRRRCASISGCARRYASVSRLPLLAVRAVRPGRLVRAAVNGHCCVDRHPAPPVDLVDVLERRAPVHRVAVADERHRLRAALARVRLRTGTLSGGRFDVSGAHRTARLEHRLLGRRRHGEPQRRVVHGLPSARAAAPKQRGVLPALGGRAATRHRDYDRPPPRSVGYARCSAEPHRC